MKLTYHYSLGSVLLSGTSRFGTMNLLDITREEVDDETGVVDWAEIVFSIGCHWIFYKWFEKLQAFRYKDYFKVPDEDPGTYCVYCGELTHAHGPGEHEQWAAALERSL